MLDQGLSQFVASPWKTQEQLLPNQILEDNWPIWPIHSWSLPQMLNVVGDTNMIDHKGSGMGPISTGGLPKKRTQHMWHVKIKPSCYPPATLLVDGLAHQVGSISARAQNWLRNGSTGGKFQDLRCSNNETMGSWFTCKPFSKTMSMWRIGQHKLNNMAHSWSAPCQDRRWQGLRQMDIVWRGGSFGLTSPPVGVANDFADKFIKLGLDSICMTWLGWICTIRPISHNILI